MILFDKQQLIVNKFTVCMNSVLIFWWTDGEMFLPIWIDEIGKNKDKSINETSLSSISTDWSIQSISIKPLNDFSRFIDWQIRYRFLSIDYSGSTMRKFTVSVESILLLDNSILNFF